MPISDLIKLILGVLSDLRVIGTVVVMLLVIEFAKFVTSYKKKPPRPKVKKEKKAAPAPAPKEEKADEGGEE